MSDERIESHGFVVAGVVSNSGEAVVATAADLAARFGTGLLCVTVEPDRLAFAEGIDGTVLSYPLDPDDYGETLSFDVDLEARLRPIASARGVELRTLVVAGEPAQCLSHLAEQLDAPLIVVGSREAGLRGSVREFFAGSVALHLSHRQRRPVVVVPLAPVPRSQALPWEDEL
ncbi:universal stress protein [Frigoribacterium sp. Leaf186]|uniref:universal stress protein n=1 Tax=Frigoribacterium sp. Leaf186 TaxID=1736293 RepID=UPI000AFF6F82|nr:universal stress protein [Frigoribacterium sp. Leaf186]